MLGMLRKLTILKKLIIAVVEVKNNAGDASGEAMLRILWK
jgi:hypothetical protein